MLTGKSDDEAIRGAVDIPPTPAPTITIVGPLPVEKDSTPKIKKKKCMKINALAIWFRWRVTNKMSELPFLMENEE